LRNKTLTEFTQTLKIGKWNSAEEQQSKKNNEMATPCIINGWFLPTYENPRGFSIRFLFAKLGAETRH
jgi:hypothetical protein